MGLTKGTIISNLSPKEKAKIVDGLTDSYFLCEAVDYVPNKGDFSFLGILINFDLAPRPPDQPAIYDPGFHSEQIEKRRLQCARNGWFESRNKPADVYLISKMDGLRIKQIVQSHHRQARKVLVRVAPSKELEPRSLVFIRLLRTESIQLQIMKGHHEKELDRIKARLDALGVNQRDGNIKSIINFNTVAEEAIESWFIRKGIHRPGIGTKIEEVQSEQELQPRNDRAERAVKAFEHSPNYTTVTKGEMTYHLLPKQAAIIKRLHEEYNKNGPGATVTKKELLDYVASLQLEHGYPGRVWDVFRSRKEAYYDLIEVVSKRLGLYRLKI